ncbi:hypothetical protein EYF80_019269 [Liparis tanakae]|uniref:Uncharacterized protein n=1 Tax=Liparis tanakae TaxID=230148 RepID=A0A4Z2HZU2_9TELE|nr:hypothetical protein EYF80_019269 [Liparis tanakae]
MSCCRARHTPSGLPWMSSDGGLCGALRSGRMIWVWVWCMTLRKKRCCWDVTSIWLLTVPPVTSDPSNRSMRMQVAFCQAPDGAAALIEVGLCLRMRRHGPEAHADPQRLRYLLDERGACIWQSLGRQADWEVKGQGQWLQILGQEGLDGTPRASTNFLFFLIPSVALGLSGLRHQC